MAALAWIKLRRDLHLLRAENASLRPYADRLFALYQFWFTLSGESLLLLDSAGCVKGVNASGEKLLGLKGVQMTGRPLTSFLKEDCETLAAIRRMLETRQEITGRRMQVKPARGPELELEVAAKLFAHASGDEWWVLLKPARVVQLPGTVKNT